MVGERKRVRGRGGKNQNKSKTHDQQVRQPKKKLVNDKQSGASSYETPEKDKPHQGEDTFSQATSPQKGNNQHQYDVFNTECVRGSPSPDTLPQLKQHLKQLDRQQQGKKKHSHSKSSSLEENSASKVPSSEVTFTEQQPCQDDKGHEQQASANKGPCVSNKRELEHQSPSLQDGTPNKCLCVEPVYKTRGNIQNEIEWFYAKENEQLNAQKSEQLNAQKSEQHNAQKSEQLNAEENEHLGAKDKEQLNAEENENLGAQEKEQLNAEENEQLNAQENGQLYVNENEQLNVNDNEQLNVNENDKLDAKETGQLIVQENEELNAKETGQLIVPETGQLIVRENEELNVEETVQLIVQENEQLNAKETGQLIVRETGQPIVQENEQLIVQKTEQLIVQENEEFNAQKNEAINAEANKKVYTKQDEQFTTTTINQQFGTKNTRNNDKTTKHTDAEADYKSDTKESKWVDLAENELLENTEANTVGNEEPDVTENEEPDVTENEEPDVTENEEPDVKENEEPDVKENEEPDVKENEEPDVKEIEEPDVKENEEPDVKKNEEPDVKEDKRHTFEENELNVKQDTGVSAKEVKDTDTKQVQEVIPKQGQGVEPRQGQGIEPKQGQGVEPRQGQGFGQVRTQHVALEEDPNQVEIKVMQNETDTNKDSMLQGTLQQHCHSQFAKIVEGKQEDKCNGKPIVEIDSKQSDKYAHKKAPHKHDNKQDEHFNTEQENKQQHQPKELVGVDHMPDHNQFTDHKNSEAKSTSIDIQQQNQGGHQFNKQVNSIQQVQKSGDHQDDGRESIGHWNDNQFNYMYLPSSMSSEQRGEDEEINWQQTSMQGAEQHSSSFLPHSENGKINSNGKAQHQRCIYNPNKYQHHINQKQVSQQDYSSNLTENIPEQIGHPVGKGDELQEKVLREYQGVVQNTQRDHHQESSKHDNCESVNQGEMHFSQQNYKHHENQQGYLQQCDQAYPDSPNHHQPHHKDCTNAYYSPPPEYGRGSYGRRPRRGRGKSEYYQQQQQQQQHQQQHHHRNQNSQGFSQSRLLTCGCCNEKYDLDFKHPRVLYCHHTFCTECIAYMYHMGTVYCYTCNKRTWRVTAPNNLPINQTLFGLMKEGICKPTVTVGESDQPVNQSYITKEDPIRGEQLCKPPKQRGKSIKTAQSDQVDSRRENLASSSSELPHDGRCVEYGIRIIAHCTTCQQWVCESCQKVDHNKKGCVLRPIKIALAEMKQNSVKKAHSTCDFLSKSVKDLQIYSDHLNVLLLSMRAAFQCFEKEYDSTKKALQEGTQNEKHLKDVELKLSSLTNLPNAIAGLQGLDNECDVAQRWMSSTLSRTISTGAVKGAAKDLLSITLQTLRTSTTDNGQVKQLVACQEKSSGKKFSHLTVNGGRIFLHCLTGTLTLKEARQLPLECFKSYLDGAASLTFFDLSWDGACQGQVYIRLTGDTVRGRQFLDLCTGEKGVSFQKTPFHRIWWKGHPGEHIWGGDYEQGDGSGGASVSNNSDIDKAGILGRAVPITAGLVAGRYEKKNVSSIFRIYTREAKGVIEEAAFGQVEFGLDVIQRAINQKNIKDVIISDCGVVLE